MEVKFETKITVRVSRNVDVDTLDELKDELEQFKNDAYLDDVLEIGGDDRVLWLRTDSWNGVEYVKISDDKYRAVERVYFDEIEEDEKHPLNLAFDDNDGLYSDKIKEDEKGD